MRVYSLPKTIADWFRYRNKLGIEVVLEALKDARNDRRVRMTEVEAYARVWRVARGMRPTSRP